MLKKQKAKDKTLNTMHPIYLFSVPKLLRWVWFLCVIILLLSAGCARNGKQRAVELYVDAVMFKELDKNEKAIEKLNSAVKANKDFSLAYSMLGQIYQELKDYEKSAASYEKATQLNPWSFRDFFNLGRVHHLMKEFVKAIEAYTNASRLRPDHIDTLLNTAQCYYEIADYNNSLTAAIRVEQIDPNATEVQKLLGDIYGGKKDYEQAIGSYKRALEIDSNNPDIMSSLGVVYLKTGRNEPAEKLLTSATLIDPNNNSAWQYLGYCYLQLNSQAAESYKNALKADSNDIEISAQLKDNMEKSITKAIECYTRAIEIDNKDWQAIKGLGVAYMFKAISDDDEQLKEKAVEQWRLSLDIKPNQPLRDKLRKLIEKYSK